MIIFVAMTLKVRKDLALSDVSGNKCVYIYVLNSEHNLRG